MKALEVSELCIGKTYLIRRFSSNALYLVGTYRGVGHFPLVNRAVFLVSSPNVPHVLVDTGDTNRSPWVLNEPWSCDVHDLADRIFVLPPNSQRLVYSVGDVVLVAWSQVYGGISWTVCFSRGTVSSLEPELKIGFTWTPPMSVPRNCIYMYDWQTLHARCRAAMHAWFLCARRARLVCKDVARLMARMVWETRDDAEWNTRKEEEEEPKKRLRKRR